MADGWKMPSILSALKNAVGVTDSDGSSILLNAGAGMVGVGVSLKVVDYGLGATASALGNLQPAQTPNLVAGLNKGISI